MNTQCDEPPPFSVPPTLSPLPFLSTRMSHGEYRLDMDLLLASHLDIRFCL